VVITKDVQDDILGVDGMGVNSKEAVMKTSWGKPVHLMPFCRTPLIVLTVAVCTVAAEDNDRDYRSMRTCHEQQRIQFAH